MVIASGRDLSLGGRCLRRIAGYVLVLNCGVQVGRGGACDGRRRIVNACAFLFLLDVRVGPL